uniref:Uncharacterized protein n=1 Tax=Nelumbo nucifera TaxID=4432 RepID=A0A822YWQ1_NELNU|nr:TPA_asm: hypothetical protein HUJ06_007234 [Nelumbo nucifera]
MEHESCRGGAKAVLNLQPNSSISIAYHPHFGPHDDLMLLEIDEKLLPGILHNRVSLRGQSDEEAVLCTPSKTYAVKFVGTSNSAFLVPPSDPSESSETASDEPWLPGTQSGTWNYGTCGSCSQAG